MEETWTKLTILYLYKAILVYLSKMISCRVLKKHVGGSRSAIDHRIPCKAKSQSALPSPPRASRRVILTGLLSGGLLTLLPYSSIALADSLPPAEGIAVLSQNEGTGSVTAQPGDLVLVHYVGQLSDGTVFDSTRGGLVS